MRQRITKRSHFFLCVYIYVCAHQEHDLCVRRNMKMRRALKSFFEISKSLLNSWTVNLHITVTWAPKNSPFDVTTTQLPSATKVKLDFLRLDLLGVQVQWRKIDEREGTDFGCLLLTTVMSKESFSHIWVWPNLLILTASTIADGSGVYKTIRLLFDGVVDRRSCIGKIYNFWWHNLSSNKRRIQWEITYRFCSDLCPLPMLFILLRVWPETENEQKNHQFSPCTCW